MSPNRNTHQRTEARSRRQASAGGFSLWVFLAVALTMVVSGCSSGPAATEPAPQSGRATQRVRPAMTKPSHGPVEYQDVTWAHGGRGRDRDGPPA